MMLPYRGEKKSDRSKQCDCCQLICGLLLLFFYTVAVASAEDEEKNAKAYKLFLASVIIKWMSCVLHTAVHLIGKFVDVPTSMSILGMPGSVIADISIIAIGWQTPCNELDLSDGLLRTAIESPGLDHNACFLLCCCRPLLGSFRPGWFP
eukprot:1169550-Rhodomonas_salina.1